LQKLAVSVTTHAPHCDVKPHTWGLIECNCQGIGTQVSLLTKAEEMVTSLCRHRWSETGSVHCLSSHVWKFDPGSLIVEAEVNVIGLQVASIKPQMQN